MMTTCVVYWLYDEQHDVCPWRHGYIGISERWSRRLIRHKSGPHYRAKNVTWRILFIGTKAECLMLEQKLRPHLRIGWNQAFGGETTGAGTRGLAKSPEWRAAMSEAAKRRYADPAERKRMSIAVKKGLKGIDRSGPNNSRFGIATSEETKAKIRARLAERGGYRGKKNPNYRHGHRVDAL